MPLRQVQQLQVDIKVLSKLQGSGLGGLLGFCVFGQPAIGWDAEEAVRVWKLLVDAWREWLSKLLSTRLAW